MNRLNTFKFVATLANDINGLLDDIEEYNVVIEVGEKPDFKIFHAHSIILKARTPYFRTALSSNWARKDGDTLIYSKPNIKPKIFEVILRFIYGGNVYMDVLDAMETLDLLIASDELLLTELTEYAQSYLLVNEFEWLEKNSITVWEKIYKYESCMKVQDYCIKLICKDPIRYLFASDEFLSMEDKVLSEFLKLDGLQIEEIELWDNILRWGLAQNPCLLLQNNNNNSSSNSLSDNNINNLSVIMTSNWAKKDFELLAGTLKNLIPLITISQISSTDFYNKIWPFRHILPDKMLEEVMAYHLDPMSPPVPVRQAKRFQFDSMLLRPSHVALISGWIDRLDQKRYVYGEMPYRFQLLLRGTQDGFDSETFHNKCDQVTRTLVVMRISKTGEIIGGYNPMMWTTNIDYKITEDSFLFSFGDRWRLEDAKLSRVLHQRSFYAIRFNGSNYGPCFGDKDLCMKGRFDESGSCSAQKDDYCASITDCKTFSVDEYEVFKIVNKRSQFYSFEFIEM